MKSAACSSLARRWLRQGGIVLFIICGISFDGLGHRAKANAVAFNYARSDISAEHLSKFKGPGVFENVNICDFTKGINGRLPSFKSRLDLGCYDHLHILDIRQLTTGRQNCLQDSLVPSWVSGEFGMRERKIFKRAAHSEFISRSLTEVYNIDMNGRRVWPIQIANESFFDKDIRAQLPFGGVLSASYEIASSQPQGEGKKNQETVGNFHSVPKDRPSPVFGDLVSAVIGLLIASACYRR
jgi:hypothetical protein